MSCVVGFFFFKGIVADWNLWDSIHRDGTVVLRSTHWDERKPWGSDLKEEVFWERGLHSFERDDTNDSRTSRNSKTSARSKTESFFKKILGGKKR